MSAATADLQELKIGDKMNSYIQLNTKVREFVKDRADLEREYARKLELLVKRHALKKDVIMEKKSNEIISTKEAWQKIVKDTVEQAKIHSNLADSLSISVSDKIKSLTIRKEDARKKNLIFINKFKTELEKMDGDLEKSKTDYYMACELVEAAKMKYEKITDERYKGKYKKQWHQSILDMNNQKNVYLLTVEAYNKMKERQMTQEFPAIIKQIEEYGSSNNISLIKIWNSFLDLQSDLAREVEDVIAGDKFMLECIDPKLETVIHPRASFFIKDPKVFEGCGLWTDEPVIQKDEYSAVYMGNRLERLKKAQNDLDKDISKRKAGIDGLEKLYQSFLSNPLAGNAEAVHDSILDENRELFILEQGKYKFKCFIDSIVDKIGEFSTECRMHKFKSSIFAIPTRCDFCQFSIWGMSKPGITCKDCTFNAHKRCEMKVEPNCSGIKGRIDSRKQRSISDPHYRSMSNFSRTTSISMFGFPRHEMQSVNEEQPRTRIEKILEPLRVESSEDAVASTIPMNLKSMSVSEVSESAYSTIRREKSFRSKRMSPAPSIMIDLVVGNPAAVMYDYFATHPEEVNIHEGEHVLVERLDDGSGWTLVSKSGLQGIVPTAYIKGLVPQASFSTLRQNSQHLDHGMAKVLYTFTKSDATELSVKEGDAIRVVQEDDGSGWIVATDGTSQGLLPANYVKTL